MITIFTPTYNRAYIIDHLYQSLCEQSNMNFKWLIVDDGSTDHTAKLIEQWRNENIIEIIYERQDNMGKSAAHNRGVLLTDTELFVCVDSDDSLTKDAVEKILDQWSRLKNEQSCIGGMLAFRKTNQGTAITKCGTYKKHINTLKGFYDEKVLSGDTMLIFRTDYIKQLSFPRFAGEKFVPEAFLYDQFDQRWKLYLLPEYLYVCDYLNDGYTCNMAKIIAKNPTGYLAFIQQRLSIDKDLKSKIFDTIRYIAISVYAENKNVIKNAVYPSIAMLIYPFGMLFYRLRYHKFKE